MGIKPGRVIKAMTGNNQKTPLKFRLYVAGKTPNSVLAVRNFNRIIEQQDADIECEIIDLFVHPDDALEDNIYAVPALRRVSPAPQVTLLGNLSDSSRVMRFFGLKEKVHDQHSGPRGKQTRRG